MYRLGLTFKAIISCKVDIDQFIGIWFLAHNSVHKMVNLTFAWTVFVYHLLCT